MTSQNPTPPADETPAEHEAESLLETARIAAIEMIARTEVARLKAADIVIERAEIRAAHLVIEQVNPKINTLQFRLNILAFFVIFGLVLISALQQNQSQRFNNELEAQCQARAASNVSRNEAWQTLAETTKDPDQIRIYLAAVSPILPC